MQMAGPPSIPGSTVDDVRQHIIKSLFTRKEENGTPEETLITFVKVYEDEGGDGGPKTRYLMLAVTKMGKVVIHKAKRNANLTFSKGKTWNLEDMRIVEVIGSVDFALTMTIRRYHWTTDKAKEQTHFLNSLIKVYRTYTKGELPELINYTPPAPPDSSNNNNNNGNNDRRPSSASSPIPMPGHMELRPPNKTSRSGSSSSVVSGGGSSSAYYPHSEASSSRSRLTPVGTPNNYEDQRTPTVASFGRSPLGDSAMRERGGGTSTSSSSGGGRRPSATSGRNSIETDRERRSMDAYGGYTEGTPEIPQGPPPGRNGSGLGMGLPSHMRQQLGPGGSPYPQETNGNGLPRSRPESPSSVNAPNRPSRSAARLSQEPNSRSNRASLEDGRPSSGHGYTPKMVDSTPRINEPPQTTTSSKIPPPIDATLTPTITTTMPSPGFTSEATLGPPIVPGQGGGERGAPERTRTQRRASFHPPPLTTAFSREVLLTSKTGILPGAAGLTVDHGMAEEDAVMNNVEEMLEGFDWTGANTGGPGGVGENGRKRGGAEAIESRLLDELTALDSANIHAFLESDDRIAQILGHMDEALLELDEIDMQITGYRMQLNAVSDDISFIEGQNRGLQVQTSNQQALLEELRQLLLIVEVPPEDLRILVNESPSSQRGIQLLEKAATALYKALQAGMDQANAEVAATIVRMKEYQDNSAQFCKRILDYMEITFKYQSDSTLANFRQTGKKNGVLVPHTSMCEYLMMYEGLVLYVKEMDEDRYQRLCSNYMGAVSSLHQAEIKELLMSFMSQINAVVAGEPNEASFTSAARSDAPKASALQKSRAVIGLGKNDPSVKQPKAATDNSSKIGELYQKALAEIINQIVSEEDFINAFLHLTDTESTFADYVELDSYFRRQAARHLSTGMTPGMVQLVRSMMDLVFGFVDGELRNWVEAATERVSVAVVGVIAVTERLSQEAEQEDTSIFFAQMFDKLLARQHAALDGFVNEQLRVIDAAKTSSKKRKGVAFFIKHFPVFVERIEVHLEGNDDLPIRGKVNGIYDKVVTAIFGSLQQLAKMDRAEGQAAEDKGQLNYHVIMIENMHHLIEDLSHLEVPGLNVYLERAKGLYEDNLSGYISLLLRRSFGRLMDFFDGVEKLLSNTPANEVSVHQSYSRSNLKKVLKDYSAKDLRKAIEAMSKRVDKHFTDEEAPTDVSTAALLQAVWKELTNELKREVARDGEIIGKCYSDSGLSLEYGPGDVEAICKRMNK